jgi:hypothetical protein
VASQLLEDIDISQSNLIADKSYSTAKLRQYIETKEGTHVTSAKRKCQEQVSL